MSKIKTSIINQAIEIIHQQRTLFSIILNNGNQLVFLFIGDMVEDQLFLAHTRILGDQIMLFEKNKIVEAVFQMRNTHQQRFKILHAFGIGDNILQNCGYIYIAHHFLKSQLGGNLLYVKHLEPFVARNDVKQILHGESLAQCRHVNRCALFQAQQQVFGNSVPLQNLRERFCIQGNSNLGAVARGLGVYVYP